MADNATNSSPHGDLMVSINGEPFATRTTATHSDGDAAAGRAIAVHALPRAVGQADRPLTRAALQRSLLAQPGGGLLRLSEERILKVCQTAQAVSAVRRRAGLPSRRGRDARRPQVL